MLKRLFILVTIFIILALSSGCAPKVQACEYAPYWSAILPYFKLMNPPDFLESVGPGQIESGQIDAEQLAKTIATWERLHTNLAKLEIAPGCQDMHQYLVDSVTMMVDAYKTLQDGDIVLFEQQETEAMEPLNLWFDEVHSLMELKTE